MDDGTEMLPGMPDRVSGSPPKATSDLPLLTLDEAIARSHRLLDEVLADYPVTAVYGLFSGGNDSVILNHVFRDRLGGIIHVNTGTGIPETTQHVRDTTAAWNIPLHELRPKDSYEDLVMGRVLATRGDRIGRPVWRGFPGPPGHGVMYRRLKDEPLQRFRGQVVGPHGRTRKIVYLAGMRWDETDRRFRNAEEVDVDGAIIWLSGIVHWTDAHMREYRARYRCQQEHEHAPHRMCTPDALPLNEVTEHLHMSGECLCGAYARPGELDEIAFFYPQVAERIRALASRVAAAGIPACRWGERSPRIAGRVVGGPAEPAGRLCRSCKVQQIPGQTDLVDQWLSTGLITLDEYNVLAGEPEEEHRR